MSCFCSLSVVRRTRGMPRSGNPSRMIDLNASSSCARVSVGRFKLGPRPPVPSNPWQSAQSPSNNCLPCWMSLGFCASAIVINRTDPIILAPLADCLAPTACIDKRSGRNFFHVSRAAARHRKSQLVTQDIENPLDALLTKSGESPDVWPADADSVSAKRQRLEDIRTTTNSAIDQDRNTSSYCLRHFSDTFDRSTASLGRAAAMIGNDDSIGTVFN